MLSGRFMPLTVMWPKNNTVEFTCKIIDCRRDVSELPFVVDDKAENVCSSFAELGISNVRCLNV